ncbi:MAG TPA: dihydrolipoamide acetyltransferase family protein [Tepidisphaeraceae bacterium]
MPQLSDTMTEGTVVKWLKKEGEKVKEGDIIAEIETDKAIMEYESDQTGTIAELTAKEGQKIPVGSRIALVAGAGEKVEDAKKGASGGDTSARSAAPPASAAPKENVGQSVGKMPSQRPVGSGSATGDDKETDHRQLDRERSQARHDQTELGTHPELPQTAAATAVLDAPSSGDRIKVSPLAKRIAQQNNVDLSQLQGSGPNGRIIQRDVEAFLSNGGKKKQEVKPLQPEAVPVLATAKRPAAQAPALPQRLGTGHKEAIPLTKMRTVIAQRLQQSKQQVPHFYETVDVDMEQVSQLRVRMNKQLEQQNVRLSVNDFVIKAVASALIENPALNATFDGQTITRYGDVNLGLAVALPEGLIVPVLRNVDQMSLREIRVRSADLYDRARAQRLKRDELSGATFSISSLGSMGVREFSAIINPPEVGILAIGAAEKRAVVYNDQLAARSMMTVTLSADHRAIDGAVAAEFLRTLKQLLEEPGLMLA